MKRTWTCLAIGIVVLLTGYHRLLPAIEIDNKEGGYVYQYTDPSEDRFLDNVWNFIHHFSYEQYYWCECLGFTRYNNRFVDAVDFAYYSGHGNNWYITMGPGAYYLPRHVALDSAGSPNRSRGWGDRSMEFVTFQSCAVIPGPPDLDDWYSKWTTEPYDLFDGLHQAIGYRTISYSGNGISNNYGNRIHHNEACWQAWFNAVNDERNGFYPGYASAVMYPECDGDSYGCFAADPPHDHTWLRIWYQYEG